MVRTYHVSLTNGYYVLEEVCFEVVVTKEVIGVRVAKVELVLVVFEKMVAVEGDELDDESDKDLGDLNSTITQDKTSFAEMFGRSLLVR